MNGMALRSVAKWMDGWIDRRAGAGATWALGHLNGHGDVGTDGVIGDL